MTIADLLEKHWNVLAFAGTLILLMLAYLLFAITARKD